MLWYVVIFIIAQICFQIPIIIFFYFTYDFFTSSSHFVPISNLFAF